MLDSVHASLLGKRGIEDLQILAFVNIAARKKIPKDEFPSFFQNPSQLQNSHYIPLRERAEPFFLNSPSHIPILLYEKIRLGLKQMEAIGVISPVDEPIEWR